MKMVKKGLLVGHYCSTVGKRVWNHIEIRSSYILTDRERTDEYDFELKDYYDVAEYLESVESQVGNSISSHMILVD